MEQDDRKAFADELTLLLEAFRQEGSAATFEAYWIGMEHMTLAEVGQAVRSAIRTCKFMPSPAEVAGTVSLRRLGQSRCAGCQVSFSYPESAARGYCGPCWKKIGGEEEDARRAALTGGDAPKELTA